MAGFISISGHSLTRRNTVSRGTGLPDSALGHPSGSFRPTRPTLGHADATQRSRESPRSRAANSVFCDMSCSFTPNIDMGHMSPASLGPLTIPARLPSTTDRALQREHPMILALRTLDGYGSCARRDSGGGYGCGFWEGHRFALKKLNCWIDGEPLDRGVWVYRGLANTWLRISQGFFSIKYFADFL